MPLAKEAMCEALTSAVHASSASTLPHHVQERRRTHHAESIGESRACFSAQATANVPLDVARQVVRRARGMAISSIRSAKICCGHVWVAQRKRRTSTTMDTARPCHAKSASARRYRLCRRRDGKPQDGQTADMERAAAKMTMRLDLNTRYDKASRHRWQVAARKRKKRGGKKAAAAAKSCGTFKYRKGGKCLDARDKK
jgi:hypothetical protein